MSWWSMVAKVAGNDTKDKKILIIGAGSIGRVHYNALLEKGHSAAFVTQRKNLNNETFTSLEEALNTFSPNLVIIANETHNHFQSLLGLQRSGYNADVLVEKPLFHESVDYSQITIKNIYVGYQLRFHPCLQWLKNFLLNEKILSVHGYVGQYLPTWRPKCDFVKSYSRYREKGGGVLRDLSHELDYLVWLLNKPKSIVARGGRVSEITFDSEDAVAFILQTDRCPLISFQMNYLDREHRRALTINTNDKTITVDLIKCIVTENGVLKKFPKLSHHQLIEIEHESILKRDTSDLADLHQGAYIVKLIEEIESCL